MVVAKVQLNEIANLKRFMLKMLVFLKVTQLNWPFNIVSVVKATGVQIMNLDKSTFTVNYVFKKHFYFE